MRFTAALALLVAAAPAAAEEMDLGLEQAIEEALAFDVAEPRLAQGGGGGGRVQTGAVSGRGGVTPMGVPEETESGSMAISWRIRGV